MSLQTYQEIPLRGNISQDFYPFSSLHWSQDKLGWHALEAAVRGNNSSAGWHNLEDYIRWLHPGPCLASREEVDHAKHGSVTPNQHWGVFMTILWHRMLTQNRCQSTCQYPGRFSQQPQMSGQLSVHFTFMFCDWLPTVLRSNAWPSDRARLLSGRHNILMTTRHKTADTGLSLPRPLSTPVLLTADIMLQSSCGSSGPGCGYIAPSTIRLTSVWTQTCINLQEDKLRALHRFRVSISTSNLLRESLRRRMQWY